MKLFTKDIDKKLFAQFMKGSDLSSQMVVAKIFNPYGRGAWYIINSDPNDPDYLWAIVKIIDVEVGSVSRSELETLRVPPFRLNLERDMSFTPMNAKELYDGLVSGKHYAKGGYMEKGGIVVDDVNNGKIINKLFNEWNSIKTDEEYKKWVDKVKNTKFGTYDNMSVSELIQKLGTDNSSVSSFMLKTFLNEVKQAEGSLMAKGGIVVTSIKDIPNFQEMLDAGKITYRGLGLGKLFDDFYKIAGTGGYRIKVDGKEYFITDTEFQSFSRGEDGKMRIKFDAPFRKFEKGGGFSKDGEPYGFDEDDDTDSVYEIHHKPEMNSKTPFMIWDKIDGKYVAEKATRQQAIHWIDNEKTFAKGGELKSDIDKLLDKRSVLEDKLFAAKVKENERWNSLGWGSGMRLSKINVSTKRSDSLKEKMKEIDSQLKSLGYDKFPVGRYAKGGEVSFADKVKAVKSSLLKRKKVAPAVQKNYGKTYSPKEAEDSAKRIVGAMTAKWKLENRMKKRK